jgi:hypothetical protein
MAGVHDRWQTADFISALDEGEDPRRVYAILQESIRMYRSSGVAVPASLRRCERDLILELAAESQGR